MIRKIIKLFAFVTRSYAFLATTLVLSQLVLLLSLWAKGYLTFEKVERLKAVYTDVKYEDIRMEMLQQSMKEEQDPQKLAETQMTQTRLVSIIRKAKNVSLFEERLREAGRRHALLEETFSNDITRMEKQILDSTRQQLSDTLKNMEANQVKDCLVGIVKDGGLDDVVAVLRQMTKTEQSKVLSEFQSDEEKLLLGEILRSIRQY